MQYMLLRTKKFTPKLRDLRQSNFLHHPLSRSPPEFLHQLGNFTPATLVPLVCFCISDGSWSSTADLKKRENGAEEPTYKILVTRAHKC